MDRQTQLRLKSDLALAKKVRARAYAPYSRFRVAAVLRGKASAGRKPEIFFGCNVENASYGATICAERGALMAAVAHGVKRFESLVLLSDSLKPIVPCGVCRQMLAEFCAPDMPVHCYSRDARTFRTFTMAELLPQSFGKDFL